MDSFLDPDERLIAVYQRIGPINLEGLRRLRRAGIRTILVEGVLSWHDVQPRPGKFYWDNVDRAIDDIREVGLKALLAVYHMPPSWVPGTFTLGTKAVQWDTTEYWLDPLNKEGVLHETIFLLHTLERYSKPDVNCMCMTPGEGARVLPPGMDCTENEAVHIVLARQNMFAQYSSDLWTSYHPATIPEGRGNQCFDAIYKALEQAWPDHNHYRLLWTFFTCANTQWMLDERYWVGAEYYTGVVENAKQLDYWGARGMVMSPRNWGKGPITIDDEVVEATRKAIEILGEVK